MKDNKETSWYINGKKVPTWAMIVGYILLFGNAMNGLASLFNFLFK